MGGRRGRRGAILAGTAAAAVLASGVGLWATDSRPFRDSYCWGAWEQNSGAPFLGDDGLAKSGSERRATESAPPSAGRHRASCTVTVTSTVPDDDSDEPLRFKEQVTVEYGPVPSGAEERRAWIGRYFDGSVSRLPDGLDGLVAGDRAMLVLPGACDVDGLPSTVTIRSESTGEGHLGKLAMPFTIGSRSEVARMLLDAANTGMREAGCAPGEPLHATSPFVTVAEDDGSAGKPLCRIPGVTFGFGPGSRYREQVGVVDGRLQTCSVVWKTPGTPDEPAAQYVMAGDPRMAALFAGLPEGAGHGFVRTECNGRQTVFYGNVQSGLKGSGRPDDRRVFENFTESVSKRLGCGAGEGA
ncbi:hypothetical protein [Streptomyces sp. NBC_00893]|uniref:hypothetical protein n=1 Tax=Streptomyces sp. NBC_00893 TaxID=2975862 RepID=UPI0022563D27|nr:hypothetical protein [Streptomyces sp. NBC_00893]MCX4848996.1 hypothetical protein [Streptomyces sp. NBC_00893]